MEILCSRPDLALWLGAVRPETLEQHRAMRDAGHLRVRCSLANTTQPMFWPLVADQPTTRPGQ